MTEPPNPFEQYPNMQPALVQSAELIRRTFDVAGIPLTHFALVVQIDDRGGQPLCTAVSWPMDELLVAADLARQAKTIFEMQHASKRVKGSG